MSFFVAGGQMETLNVHFKHFYPHLPQNSSQNGHRTEFKG